MLVLVLVAISQVCTVRSSEADARKDPSGENVTDVTEPRCPVKVAVQPPMDKSQSRTLPSCDPDARRAPSGEKETDVTLQV